MTKVHKVLLYFISLALTGLGVGLVHHHMRKDPNVLLSALPQDRDVCLKSIHHVATRDGVKAWTLDADSAQYQKAMNKSVFRDISATFFFKGGKTLHLTSRDGVLFTDTKDLDVSGDVIVRSGSYELKAEKLHYDYNGQSISTTTPISMKAQGILLTGQRMALYCNANQALVQGGVKAVFANGGL